MRIKPEIEIGTSVAYGGAVIRVGMGSTHSAFYLPLKVGTDGLIDTADLSFALRAIAARLDTV